MSRRTIVLAAPFDECRWSAGPRSDSARSTPRRGSKADGRDRERSAPTPMLADALSQAEEQVRSLSADIQSMEAAKDHAFTPPPRAWITARVGKLNPLLATRTEKSALALRRLTGAIFLSLQKPEVEQALSHGPVQIDALDLLVEGGGSKSLHWWRRRGSNRVTRSGDTRDSCRSAEIMLDVCLAGPRLVRGASGRSSSTPTVACRRPSASPPRVPCWCDRARLRPARARRARLGVRADLMLQRRRRAHLSVSASSPYGSPHAGLRAPRGVNPKRAIFGAAARASAL
jgi:hypothetical protein